MHCKCTAFAVHFTRVYSAFAVHFTRVCSAFYTHFQCILHAFAVHFTRICIAFCTRLQCILHAFAVHFTRVYSAFYMHLQCILHAFTVHFTCIYSAFYTRLQFRDVRDLPSSSSLSISDSGRHPHTILPHVLAHSFISSTLLISLSALALLGKTWIFDHFRKGFISKNDWSYTNPIQILHKSYTNPIQAGPAQ